MSSVRYLGKRERLFVVVEMLTVVNLADIRRFKASQCLHNFAQVLVAHLATLVALRLLQWLPQAAAINKSHLATTLLGLVLVHNPQISVDACIEKLLLRHLYDSLHPVVIEDVFAYVALAATSVARKERRAIVHLNGYAIVSKLPKDVLHEEKLPVAY